MIAQLRYLYGLFRSFIDDSVFIVYATGPESRKGVFQRLWFSDPFKRIAFDLFDQRIDASQDFPVVLLPIKIIFPGMVGENPFHSMRSLSMPLSSASWTMDSMSRRVFLGERKR